MFLSMKLSYEILLYKSQIQITVNKSSERSSVRSRNKSLTRKPVKPAKNENKNLQRSASVSYNNEENSSIVENYISKQTIADNLLAESTSTLSTCSGGMDEKFEDIRRDSLLLNISKTDTRVDKVYTVGCFDLFHYGHIQLFERMSSIGKKLVVGVHDSRRYV
jgi:bifunctional ADP-heptose synthase (sugar kinase/adenylyltransferase)